MSMLSLYQHHKNFIHSINIEDLVKEVFRFKNRYYTEENLASHVAYLSDTQPNRTSSAFALKFDSFKTDNRLPSINMNEAFEAEFPLIFKVTSMAFEELGLWEMSNRVLFNIQEYYDSSTPVPKHFDGEFLDFYNTPEGELVVNKGIRPMNVGVLTLVNNTDGGGTTLHHGEEQATISARPGDLVVFDNQKMLHSVAAMNKNGVVREDKLIRLIIGWRSLSQNCRLLLPDGKSVPLTIAETNDLLADWMEHEWPKKWQEIQETNKKAAF